MQPVRAAVAVLLAGVLAVGSAQGRTLDQVPGYLKREGNFVSLPALALGGIGLGVGGLIGLPGSLIAAPIGFLSGDPLGYALVPPAVTAVGCAELGYHVGGAIPWVLKNAFYDAPMAGIARVRGQAPSGLVAEVQPVRLDPTRTQYLASTPPRERVLLADNSLRSAALPPPRDAKSLVLLKRRISPFKPPPGTPGGGPLVARAKPVVPVVPQAPRAATSVPPAPVVPAAPLSPVAYAAPALPPMAAPPATVPAMAEPPPAVEPVAPAVAPGEAMRPEPVAPPPPVEQAPAVLAVTPVAEAAPAVEATPVVEAAPAAGEPAATGPGGAAAPRATPAPAADSAGQRPSLQQKKKRKFSERFNF